MINVEEEQLQSVMALNEGVDIQERGHNAIASTTVQVGESFEPVVNDEGNVKAPAQKNQDDMVTQEESNLRIEVAADSMASSVVGNASIGWEL